MIQCPNCGAQNPEYARECTYCATDLSRPELSEEAADLRDLILGMSLGVEDFNTVCFALDVDWHPMYDMKDEAGKTEMLVRQLADQGRVDEVQRFLRDFRFPQGYPPLPEPPADNLWLTYVYACQNVTSMDQLQKLVEQIGMSDASQLPGAALPHKTREAMWVARRANALPAVHEWLATLSPEEGLTRPRIRERRRPGQGRSGSYG
ncbi:zinc ribbon domain-containing protein [Chloroflexota bacterium]